MGLFSQISDVPPGGTWQSARTKINSNFATALDSLTAHHLRILSNTQAHTLNYNGILSLIDSTAKYRGIIEQLQSDVTALEIGGGITYPGAGIPLSTGSSWGTSITNNSSNWNTAYGWGNHAGLYEPTLGNPGANGYVLSSTTGGTRSWVQMTGGTGGDFDTTYINARIEALEAVVVDTVQLLAESPVTLTEGAGTVTIGIDMEALAGELDLSGAGMDYDTITYLNGRINELEELLNSLLANLDNIGIDLTSPTFYSAEVRNDTLWITLNGADINQGIIPDKDDFALTEDAASFGLTSIALSDSVLTFKLDSTTVYGSTYLVSYTQPEMAALQDSTGNKMASFTNRSVTNSNEEPEEPDYSASFTLTSNENGSGVSTLRYQVSEDITVTLDEAGNFYTNSGGTEGESQTWNVTAGAMRTIYLKVTSGASTMTLSDASKVTSWGDASNNGWASGTNASSISGDISQFSTALAHWQMSGSNTLSGSIAGLTGLMYVDLIGGFSISGSIANLTSLTRLQLISWKTMNVTGSIEGLTELDWLSVTGTNTLSGSIAGLTNLTYVQLLGSNTVSGSISALTSLTNLYVSGSNTLSGSVGGLNNITYLRIIGGQNTVTYGARVLPANTSYYGVTPASGSGWSVADITAAINEAAATTWAGERLFAFGNVYQASMANTTQGGIWGDFSGEAAPSALAVNLKTLVQTRTVTVSLNGITIPLAEGDGAGFPAGFGNWWRE